ncbi:SH3 domain-containing protein [Capilliphycus salinus ALCB114379]|uniref:SH3 domain-containing protein n=1 Tax=Capilliphycus salinus TaxID=2768948 RepID=UPI0039A708B6
MNHWQKYLMAATCATVSLLGLNTVAQALTNSADLVTSGEYQLAQTPVGSCTVADPTGTPLNVRSRPNGNVVGTVENGTIVALGVTDGSEGENWTRIISPIEGYVWNDYLTSCKYRY